MHRMRRRHAVIALDKAAHHAAACDNRVHDVAKILAKLAALLVRQRRLALFQQHSANR